MTTKFGYYQAMGQQLENKLTSYAMTIPHGHWPHWNFNEEQFSAHDWTQEPSQSLEQLYLERARQIRSRYDYLILSWSGGADSQNIAEIMVRNGIRIDHLVYRNALFTADSTKTSRAEENAVNESLWCVPLALEKLRRWQPDIALTMWDWSKDVLDFWKNQQFDLYSQNCPTVVGSIKHRILDTVKIPSWAKSVGVIYGIDKPLISYENNRFSMFFMDETVHIQSGGLKNHYDVTHELFYWAPESVPMLIKQGHIIKKWFRQNPELLYLLSRKLPNKQLYYELINPIIYPWYDPSLYQALKSKHRFFTGLEQWFHTNRDHTSIQSWLKTMQTQDAEIKSIFKSVKDLDTGFKSTYESGFEILPSCYSKFYDLGT